MLAASALLASSRVVINAEDKMPLEQHGKHPGSTNDNGAGWGAYYELTLPATLRNVGWCSMGMEGEQILVDDIVVYTYDSRESR